MNRLIWAFGLAVLTGQSLSAAPSKPTLKVYTYDSFQSKWGPGPKLKEEFLKTCDCDVQFVTAVDAGALLGKLKLEGSKTKADVVVGLDSTSTAAAKKLNIFAPWTLKADWAIPVSLEDTDVFQPIDFGWFTFMIDSKETGREAKNKISVPDTLEAFLKESTLKNRVLIQDPRSSSVGLGLLLWLHARFQDRATEQLKLLRSQVLAVSPGWSDSYSKFTKGEGAAVLSYTTSEAYHREEESTDRFKALSFSDGHYLQVEVAGKIKHTKVSKLVDDFLTFLATPKAQAIIARGNWMYPAVSGAVDLPASYSKIPRPAKSLYLPSSVHEANRDDWTREWLKIFASK